MEIFTAEELEVAEIMVGLSRKILFPIIDVHWSRKRKRSLPSCKPIPSAGIKLGCPSSSTSSASPEPLSVIMPPLLPLPINVENLLLPSVTTVNKSSTAEHQNCVAQVDSSSRIAATTSDDVISTPDQEQNHPAKKMRMEDISQLILTNSKQKEALVDGMEAAMTLLDELKVFKSKSEENEALFKCIHQRMKAALLFYERIKESKLQLEEEERKLKLCLKQEESFLKQHKEQEEQNLKRCQEQEEQHSHQNHTAATNDNSQARPLFDLNFPPLEY